jgi:c(7)-type cytochrome triheme protein
MRKLMILVLVVMVTFVLAGAAFAVGPGKTIEFEGGGAGKVMFTGDAHKAAKCNECHPALFKMKKGGDTIKMADINAGKFCGACHNGTKAFAAKECAKCHKK